MFLTEVFLVNVVNVFATMSALSEVQRFSMTRLATRESVLEHLAFVTILATALAREVNFAGGSMDVGKVSRRAMIHDLDEVVTGDCPRPVKYHSREVREMFRKMEEWGVDKTLANMRLSDELTRAIKTDYVEAKDGREGLIVSMADAMAVVYKTWDEVLVRGNLAMVGHARAMIPQLDELRAKISSAFVNEVARATLDAIVIQCSSLMVRAASQDDALYGSEMRT